MAKKAASKKSPKLSAKPRAKATNRPKATNKPNATRKKLKAQPARIAAVKPDEYPIHFQKLVAKLSNTFYGTVWPDENNNAVWSFDEHSKWLFAIFKNPDKVLTDLKVPNTKQEKTSLKNIAKALDDHSGSFPDVYTETMKAINAPNRVAVENQPPPPPVAEPIRY